MGSDRYVTGASSLLPATEYREFADVLIPGSFSEVLGNLDDAMMAYEQALRANPQSIQAMNAISLILRTKEEFHKAVEYLNAIIKLDSANGEAWGSLGSYFARQPPALPFPIC